MSDSATETRPEPIADPESIGLAMDQMWDQLSALMALMDREMPDRTRTCEIAPARKPWFQVVTLTSGVGIFWEPRKRDTPGALVRWENMKPEYTPEPGSFRPGNGVGVLA